MIYFHYKGLCFVKQVLFDDTLFQGMACRVRRWDTGNKVKP